MNKNLYRIISFILIILWMIVIFCFSAMEGKESGNKSKFILKQVFKIFYNSKVDEINKSNKTNAVKEISKLETPEEKAERLDTPFRKFMHGTVYFILVLLVYNFINTFNLKREYVKYLISLIIAFLYACSDEYHQTFVRDRGGQFRDVLIDTFGGILACLIVVLVKKIIKLKKNNT